MLSHKMDFNCCANRDGFRIDSHIYKYICIHMSATYTYLRIIFLFGRRDSTRPTLSRALVLWTFAKWPQQFIVIINVYIASYIRSLFTVI